ncbi:GH18587 [Drosophila grimshawi]|uniref:GH18587 n=1 Tax=Drosophila grimshawi TaxID=7222 RepID=B4JHX5_DROGR|nr:GH18587 [Drosophila grimshawi]
MDKQSDMDLTKVYVVRSAKGVDMLCVDDYLYHFDRIGKNNTYRWLCNRRKDKVTPCRSRISTMMPDSMDKTTHVVVDVIQEHVHPRCSDHEITKVTQRKRLSNMKMNDAYSTTQPKRARLYERATAGLNPPEWISTNRDSESINEYSFHLDFEDKDRVYMMRRRDGRVMVCIDGHLYYLAGKSYKGSIYRWTCVRKRDIECTAKICTEATLAGAHRLHVMETDAHIHPHYSADKLMQMFSRHQILLVDDEQTVEVLQECPNLEYFDPDISSESQRGADDDTSIIIEDCEENYEVYVNMEGETAGETVLPDQDQGQQQQETTSMVDDEIKWPTAVDIIDHYVAPADYDPLSETDLTKFTFLPSAKGRRVLCLDRHLFHFDSQSRSNGHMFFTCIMRRDKQQICHVRVTMNPVENGLEVLRINGEHTHKPDLQEIMRRIKQQKQQEKLQSVTKTGDLKPEQPSLGSGNEDIEFESQDEEDEHEAITQHESSYENLKDHSSSSAERNVVMKKVIGIDGIKLEPEQSKAAPMIVQYLNDGADNISAQIEILSTDQPCTSTSKPQLTNLRKRRTNPQQALNTTQTPTVPSDMDLTKICTLRSAKGSEMLCVDGYIYHAKNRGLISRNYWVCIKSRDSEINCKSRISTATQKDGSIRVLRVYNSHSHPYSEDDIKRRLFNEINKKNNKKLKFRPLHFIGKSLEQIKQEYGDLAVERLNVSNLTDGIVVHKKPRNSSSNSTAFTVATTASRNKQREHEQHYFDEDVVVEEEEEGEDVALNEDSQFMTVEEDNTDAIIEVVEEVAEMEHYGTIEPIYTMKLYAVSDGPPSLAVRMTLKALDIQYQLINVDFCALEHRTEDYAKLNPQKEIPVLDDEGFHLSESIAIMQYLCDKYAPLSTLYPEDPNERALVNQRLCFNMNFYYAPISAHSMAPIFFAYERTPMSLKKVENALDVFETYLQRLGTKYAASDNVTIADFALVSSTLCLEAIDFDLTSYPLVQKWYATFKAEYPNLWQIANSGMQEINAFEHNPPDLSQMDHPFHPTRKSKA